jgi:hypothetical protein
VETPMQNQAICEGGRKRSLLPESSTGFVRAAYASSVLSDNRGLGVCFSREA